MNQVTLLVLAAGMGSRYGGLKQLDPVGPNGETVIDYSVFDAIRAGFSKVVFVIREEFSEEFTESIGSRFVDKIAVEYAYQDINKFINLTGDKNKIHYDKKYANKTYLKKPVAHGMLGASFISTLIGTKLPGDGAIWFSQNLLWDS